MVALSMPTVGGICIVLLTVFLVYNDSHGTTIHHSSSSSNQRQEQPHHGDDDDSNRLQLPTFWDSHMVLQREPVESNIWGWAAPGANVSVILDRRTIMSTDVYTDTNEHGRTTVTFSIASNKSGIWSVDFPPQRAGSGYSIHITDGSKSIVLEDVAFGDVYLCSGQSNMQMSVPATFNASAEVRKDRKNVHYEMILVQNRLICHFCCFLLPNKILDSNHYPNLRLATVDLVTADTPQNDAPSKATYTWARSSPMAVNGGNGFAYYSATCYYFGRELHQAMQGKVPIGLVTACWGGQTVETFSSPDALADQTCGGTRPRHGHDTDNNQLQYNYNMPAANDGSTDQPQPTQLWNAMIHPLCKMRFKGVIWYQGEANAGDPISYACRFPAMISDWRLKFQLPDLSFVFVQLAGFQQDNFPLLRAAQMAALQIPNVGFATAIDLGDPSSTSGAIHPRRKQEVGRRLSLTVRSLQYHERGGLVYSGPILNGVQINTNDESGYLVRMSFESGSADGLHTAGSPECVACCSAMPFHILDTSGKWIRVDQGQIRGMELYLSSNKVMNVYGIRYAWEGYPQCLLYNGKGGPDDHKGIAASPFEWCAYPSGYPSWTDQACNVPSGMEISILATTNQ
jgi:sialate O-acetylesterase